jgi:hypothetical protein
VSSWFRELPPWISGCRSDHGPRATGISFRSMPFVLYSRDSRSQCSVDFLSRFFFVFPSAQERASLIFVQIFPVIPRCSDFCLLLSDLPLSNLVWPFPISSLPGSACVSAAKTVSSRFEFVDSCCSWFQLSLSSDGFRFSIAQCECGDLVFSHRF